MGTDCARFFICLHLSFFPPVINDSRAPGLPNPFFRRRQKVLVTDHRFTGFFFQFKPGIFGDPPPFLPASLFSGMPGGLHTFGNLTGGKFGQGGKDQFRFTHVVAQILDFEAFEVFVFLDGNPGPLLMNDIGQNGEFLAPLSRGLSSSR